MKPTQTHTPGLSLTDLAVDAVNCYDDEHTWNEFFTAWMASGKPVKPGHSGARMAAELLAAEVVRLRRTATCSSHAELLHHLRILAEEDSQCASDWVQKKQAARAAIARATAQP